MRRQPRGRYEGGLTGDLKRAVDPLARRSRMPSSSTPGRTALKSDRQPRRRSWRRRRMRAVSIIARAAPASLAVSRALTIRFSFPSSTITSRISRKLVNLGPIPDCTGMSPGKLEKFFLIISALSGAGSTAITVEFGYFILNRARAETHSRRTLRSRQLALVRVEIRGAQIQA